MVACIICSQSTFLALCQSPRPRQTHDNVALAAGRGHIIFVGVVEAPGIDTYMLHASIM